MRRVYIHSLPLQCEEEKEAYDELEDLLRHAVHELTIQRGDKHRSTKRKRDRTTTSANSHLTMNYINTRLQQCRQACIAYCLVDKTANADTRSKRSFLEHVPLNWKGTCSTKMKLVKHYATSRLPVWGKMLVLSCYVQALLVAQVALHQVGVRTFLITATMKEDQRTATIHAFTNHDGRAVLLLSTAAAGSVHLGRNNHTLCRALLLDSDWNTNAEELLLAQLWRWCPELHCVTRLLITESVDEQAYCFFQEKRKAWFDSVIQRYQTGVKARIPKKPGLRSLEGVYLMLTLPAPSQWVDEEEQEEDETDLCKKPHMLEDMLLLHPMALWVQTSIPMGVCLFGLALCTQSLRWHLDPLFLVHNLFRELRQACFLGNTTQQPLSTLCVRMQFCCVTRPLHRQILGHTWKSLPEHLVQYHSSCVRELHPDARQLLYYASYFSHYYQSHSGEDSEPVCLPTRFFHGNDFTSLDEEEEEEAWTAPSMNALLRLVLLCTDESVATTLLLALLYRNTPNHRAYFHRNTTDLSVLPLLLFHDRQQSCLYMIQCDESLRQEATTILQSVALGGELLRLHIPLYMGCDWLEQLHLESLCVLEKVILPDSESTCYTLCSTTLLSTLSYYFKE